VVALSLLLSPVIPSLSFWLAGLRLPDLPTGPADIGRDVDPVPEHIMHERTAVTEDYATAIYVALAVVCGGGLSWLARGDDWASTIFTVMVCLVLSLRFAC
jgi:ESX secretion system protein EccD